MHYFCEYLLVDLIKIDKKSITKKAKEVDLNDLLKKCSGRDLNPGHGSKGQYDWPAIPPELIVSVFNL